MAPEGPDPSDAGGPALGIGVRPILIWMVLGAVLGGLVGAGYALSQPQVYQAQSVISIAPQRSIVPTAGSEEQDVTASFIQSELIVFNGPQVRAEVRRRMGEERVGSYVGTQIGNTTVVNVTASAATSSAAMATVATVADVYAEARRQRLRNALDGAARVVDSELGRLERAFGEEGPGSEALRSEYGRLLAVRSELFRAEASVTNAVTEVQPPTALGSGGPLRLLRPWFLATVLGALAGLVLLLFLRPLTRKVRSSADLARSGVLLLRPSLPRHFGGMGALSRHPRVAAAARMIAGQLVPAGQQRGALVLFGATRGVGASWAATAVAGALAERGRDVLLVLAADVLEPGPGSAELALGVEGHAGIVELRQRRIRPENVVDVIVPSPVPSLSVLTRGAGAGGAAVLQTRLRHGLLQACAETGAVVVVDSPCLADSSAVIEMAAQVGGATLVVGAHVSHMSDVADVRLLFERQGLVLDGVVINNPARSLRRRRRRSKAVPAGVEDHIEHAEHAEHAGGAARAGHAERGGAATAAPAAAADRTALVGGAPPGPPASEAGPAPAASESRAEQSPAEPVPVEAAPVETVPVEAVPVEAAPVQSVPVEAVIDAPATAGAVPAESRPVEPIPAEPAAEPPSAPASQVTAPDEPDPGEPAVAEPERAAVDADAEAAVPAQPPPAEPAAPAPVAPPLLEPVEQDLGAPYRPPVDAVIAAELLERVRDDSALFSDGGDGPPAVEPDEPAEAPAAAAGASNPDSRDGVGWVWTGSPNGASAHLLGWPTDAGVTARKRGPATTP